MRNRAEPQRLHLSRAAACFLLLQGTAIGAAAAEINPYILPSQQRVAAPIEAVAPAQPSAPAAISSGWYQRYARSVEILPAGERARLKTAFTAKQFDAVRAGKLDEAEHYEKLVRILNAAR